MNPKEFLPSLSIDCVIFGFHDNQLKVLLLKFKGYQKWNLPGGFIKKNEDVDNAAIHVLRQRTGLSNVFLTQFKVFGEVDRGANDDHKHEPSINSDEMEKWLSNRFASIGYYALVEYSKVNPQPDVLSDACSWFSLDEVPELILDHKKILDTALSTLRKQLKFQPIGLNLLPEKFTLPEIHALYETLLGRKLDRRNFKRKITSYGILTRLEERRNGVAHRAPYLYSFNEENYQRALEDGFNSFW